MPLYQAKINGERCVIKTTVSRNEGASFSWETPAEQCDDCAKDCAQSCKLVRDDGGQPTVLLCECGCEHALLEVSKRSAAPHTRARTATPSPPTEEPVAKPSTKPNTKTPKAEKGGRKPKLNEAWAQTLGDNERLAKSGKTPLTDDQLRQKMAKLFPDKADKTTITRVSMIRSIYNKGTNLFAKMGPGRPQSHAYNGDEPKAKPRAAAPKPTAASKPAPRKRPVLMILGKKA